MRITVNASIRLLAPLLGLLLLLAVDSPGARQHAVNGMASVSIVAFACAPDKSSPPEVKLLTDPRLARSGGKSIPERALAASQGVWRIYMTVPIGHWFIRLLSPHCSAIIDDVSVEGEARSFVTGLYIGDATTVDASTNYIAGTLPFPGLTTIYASPDGSPINGNYATLNGRYFYITDLRAGRYVLVVNIGLYQLLIPIDFFGRAGEGRIERITVEQIEDVIKRSP